MSWLPTHRTEARDQLHATALPQPVPRATLSTGPARRNRTDPATPAGTANTSITPYQRSLSTRLVAYAWMHAPEADNTVLEPRVRGRPSDAQGAVPRGPETVPSWTEHPGEENPESNTKSHPTTPPMEASPVPLATCLAGWATVRSRRRVPSSARSGDAEATSLGRSADCETYQGCSTTLIASSARSPSGCPSPAPDLRCTSRQSGAGRPQETSPDTSPADVEPWRYQPRSKGHRPV